MPRVRYDARLIEPLSTEMMSVEVPLPVRTTESHARVPPALQASTTLCAVGAPAMALFRSILYQSAENRRRSNDSTTPRADSSATSGFRFGLPPVMLT